MWPYSTWLLVSSAAFVVLERVRPWRRTQPLFRPGLLRDLAFLACNGHYLGVALAPVNGWLALQAVVALRPLGLAPSPLAPSLPLAGQLLAYLVVADFLQWCIHNLLHRVPFLWTFHKVHHSIATMDWIGNWRFSAMEIVVYKTLQWLPLAWLGAPGEVVLPIAVLGTFWGNFNHSNLNASLGPLGYVFNSPRMHLWHHDYGDEGGAAKNFGIVFSLWDFVFRTAFWPRDRNPARLGYPGMEEMPAGLGQLLWPLTRVRPPRRERSVRT